jgi:antitoxin MazE
MVTKAQMARWGNSLAVRIPKELAKEANLQEGDNLTLIVESVGVVSLHAEGRPKTLEEMVAGITPENRHKELHWGNPVGAEIW